VAISAENGIQVRRCIIHALIYYNVMKATCSHCRASFPSWPSLTSHFRFCVKKADKKKRTIAATHTSLDNFDDETDEDQIINKKYIGAVSPQVSAFAEENDIESCESAIPIQYTVTQRGGLAFDDVYAILEEGAEAIINDGSSENQVFDARLIPLEDVDSDRQDTSLMEIQRVHSYKLYGREACIAASW
jgi:hypothetical protein